MTSAQKGEGGQEMQPICRQTVQILQTERGEGGQKCQNPVDVIYGSPFAFCVGFFSLWEEIF